MDIGWAQELLGRQNTLDSISLRLTDGSDPAKIAADLVETPSAGYHGGPRPQSLESRSGRCWRVFQLSLQAMSLVSLLVGDVPDLQHDRSLSRAPSVRDRHSTLVRRDAAREVRWLFLGEAAVLEAIGIAVGLAGG